MVCDRCIMVVRREFEESGIPLKRIQLGEVESEIEPATDLVEQLKQRLNQLGFELLDDERSRIVEQIKTVIIKLVHNNETGYVKKKLPIFLSEALSSDYHYLSSLFTTVEGITIEKYLILQKIERVKELLLYNELTLNQIGDTLGYSSVQHLSTQFKQITGLTPSHFKQLKETKRLSLDKVGKSHA